MAILAKNVNALNKKKAKNVAYIFLSLIELMYSTFLLQFVKNHCNQMKNKKMAAKNPYLATFLPPLNNLVTMLKLYTVTGISG